LEPDNFKKETIGRDLKSGDKTMKRTSRTRKILGFENLEQRRLMAADIDLGSGYTNPDNPFDVDGSGAVSTDDLQAIVALLDRGGPRALPHRSETGDVQTPFVDVNGDGFVTAVDVLMVANKLNASHGHDPSADGESPADPIGNACFPYILDVDGSGSVTEEDAEMIIDELNEFGTRRVPCTGSDRSPTDVNGDGLVSPLDVLLVRNRLKNGEGEPDDESSERPFKQITFPAEPPKVYGPQPRLPQDWGFRFIDNDKRVCYARSGDPDQTRPKSTDPELAVPNPGSLELIINSPADLVPEFFTSSDPIDLESSIEDIADDISAVWTDLP